MSSIKRSTGWNRHNRFNLRTYRLRRGMTDLARHNDRPWSQHWPLQRCHWCCSGNLKVREITPPKLRKLSSLHYLSYTINPTNLWVRMRLIQLHDSVLAHLPVCNLCLPSSESQVFAAGHLVVKVQHKASKQQNWLTWQELATAM